MSLSREDMLRELELLPVWKLRDAPAPVVQGSVPAEPVSAPGRESVPAPVAAEAAIPSMAEEVQITSGATNEPDDLAGNRPEQISNLDWQALQRCVQDCTACELSVTRTQAVFGVGDPQADWMIIGEAPGAEEDRKGEPFVGQAGKLLDNMLAAINLKRGQNVYIANIVKCRPPGNRDPQADEITQCEPFLQRQLALIQPKLIVTVGRVAAQTLLQTDASVGSLRGRLHRYQGVPLIVTYHPAYLLRNLPDKARAWEDLCLARRTMQELQTTVQA